MRVYVSVDMEGIAGVSHVAPTRRGDSGYEAAVRLMDGETNAAIGVRSMGARPRSWSTTAMARCTT